MTAIHAQDLTESHLGQTVTIHPFSDTVHSVSGTLTELEPPSAILAAPFRKAFINGRPRVVLNNSLVVLHEAPARHTDLGLHVGSANSELRVYNKSSFANPEAPTLHELENAPHVKPIIITNNPPLRRTASRTGYGISASAAAITTILSATYGAHATTAPQTALALTGLGVAMLLAFRLFHTARNVTHWTR